MTPSPIADVAPEDAPPEQRLSFEPEIGSIEDLAVAVHEISWLESREQTENAKVDQAIRLLKAEAEQRRQIKVGRNNTTLTERQAALAAAIVAFVEANPEVITETGKKTRKFTHGEISLRSTKLSIAPQEDCDWDQVLETVRDLNYRRFYEIVYKLDKSRIIEEVAAGKFEPTKIGCRRVEPEDQVKIKPGHYTVETPAAL